MYFQVQSQAKSLPAPPNNAPAQTPPKNVPVESETQRGLVGCAAYAVKNILPIIKKVISEIPNLPLNQISWKKILDIVKKTLKEADKSKFEKCKADIEGLIHLIG